MKQSPWFVIPAQKPNAKARIFYFPYAGGSAAAFRPWKDLIHEDVELVIVQLPGRENHTANFLYSVDDVINSIFPFLEKLLDKPFYFLGHSMGSLIAFELTRELAKRGLPSPRHLFVSGKKAPDIPNKRSFLHELSDEDFAKRIKKFNGTPRVVLENAELMEFFSPRLKADFSINETYRFVAHEKQPVPITAFCGTDDYEAKVEDVKQWQKMTDSTFDFKLIPGEHFYIHTADYRVLSIINYKIEESLSEKEQTLTL